jgi:hypothetical protein
MSRSVHNRWALKGAYAALFGLALGTSLAMADESERSPLVLTSTNDPAGNKVAVFRIDAKSKALTLVQLLPTGGKGGAGGNAGIVQFHDGAGAVANFGSNSVSRLARHEDAISVERTITLAPGCVRPDSVALARDHLYVAGATCAESYSWPSGVADGVVGLSDASAAQIAVGKTWGAITFTAGSLVQLGLEADGTLNGAAEGVTLPSNANSVPLGAAFWRDVLGFTPAHSPDSFAIVDANRTVYPVAGPTPAFPSNAPCWIAKGPGNAWYTSNSPGHAISIFYSDDRGGVFYKSVAVPGVPTDLAVSEDQKWLTAIYTAGGSAYVAAFAINRYGDLTLAATSAPIGVAAFNGMAISE